MLWFRNNYTPNPEDWKKWDNSPIFAPEESFKGVPDAWVAVAELDILRDEGIAYARAIDITTIIAGSHRLPEIEVRVDSA